MQKPTHETVSGIVRIGVKMAEQYRDAPTDVYESYPAKERRMLAAKEAALAILRHGDVVILYRTRDEHGHGVNPLAIGELTPKDVFLYMVSENAKETYGHTSTLQPTIGDFRLRVEAVKEVEASEKSTDKDWNRIMNR